MKQLRAADADFAAEVARARKDLRQTGRPDDAAHVWKHHHVKAWVRILDTTEQSRYFDMLYDAATEAVDNTEADHYEPLGEPVGLHSNGPQPAVQHRPEPRFEPELDTEPEERPPVTELLLDGPQRPTPEWLIPGAILHPEIMFLFGSGGAGKSTVYYHMAAAMAGGYAMFGDAYLTPPAPQSILIVSAEDSPGVVQNRIVALADGHGWDLDRIRPTLHVWTGPIPNLAKASDRAHVAAVCQELGVDRVYLDPLANFLGDKSESDSGDMGQIVNWIRQDIVGQGVSFDSSTHNRKGGKEDREKAATAADDDAVLNAALAESLRGSSHIVNSARLVYYVGATSHQFLTVRAVKGNLGRPIKFELERHVLADPDPRSTCWDSATLKLQGGGDTEQGETVLVQIVTAQPGILKTQLMREAQARYRDTKKLSKAYDRATAKGGPIEVVKEKQESGQSGHAHYVRGALPV